MTAKTTSHHGLCPDQQSHEGDLITLSTFFIELLNLIPSRFKKLVMRGKQLRSSTDPGEL